ncbi:MAG TPA: DegT/DnrJ/EryC1/StrS family aminotransferase [Gemmatimonadales bacterium]|nr:DegT/DnrJ/EryC1/StrS family aminotransferase [Gemmatimonadales bacterium]
MSELRFTPPAVPLLHHQPPAHSPIAFRALGAGVQALASGRQARDAGHRLTRLLRDQFRATDVLLTDSGTSALSLALAGGARLRPGSAVALPAYCCYDVATAADGAGVPVVLYDLDPATLGPRADSLRAALSQGASSVVVAHLYGYPVDLPEVQALAQRHGALLMEDAAQGVGARFHGVALGSFGSLSVLSLGRGKGWTGGSGGALLAHDDRGVEMVSRARATLGAGSVGLADLVRLAAQWVLGRPGLYGLPAALPFLHLGETIYHPPHQPRAATPASVAAALANAELLDGELEVRRANARRLLAAVRAGGRMRPVSAPDGSEPGYLRLPVMCPPEAISQFGSVASLGVAPGYPRALCDLPGFCERVANRGQNFDGARELAGRLVTLPTHSRLVEADLRGLEQWCHAATG